MNNRILVSVVVCGLLGSMISIARADNPEATDYGIVAHRGFSFIAPENTLIAYKMAAEAGADAGECDVYRTADGKIVLMHDDKVDRTTNGHGKIVGHTLAELQTLDAGSWKNKCYATERVPTLEEYLAKLRQLRCKAVIEIKMPGITNEVVNAVRQMRMFDQASIIAFDKNVVKEVRRLEPTLPCGWLAGKPKDWEKMSWEKRVAYIALQVRECGATFVDMEFNMLSAEVMAELQRQRIVVWVWTVNNPEDMKRLLAWGVASITTDRPDVLRNIVRQMPPSEPTCSF